MIKIHHYDCPLQQVLAVLTGSPLILQEPDTGIGITCTKRRTPLSPLLEKPDSLRNEVRAHFDRPRKGTWCLLVLHPRGTALSKGQPGGAQARWGAQGLHPSWCDHARLCCLCHHPAQGWWHKHSSSWLCQGHHSNRVIDLPLFNPRGHIEVRCKICWSLNSFQVMAHVSGNKSMCQERRQW